MSELPFNSVLVANRGEIAARVLRTVRALGLRALLVAHEVDGRTPAMELADDVRFVDGPTPVAAFLDAAGLLDAAKAMGAQALHPGYGFLSENADFARRVETAGLTWIGPTPDSIELMGDKVRARAHVAARGFPVAPSAVEDDDPGSFADRARALGPPILLKPSAGGGGKGMRLVRDMADLEDELARARSEAQRYFGDGRLFAERYVERPRHIEVQVLGDAHGEVIHLFERECSLQRRFQKIIEEAPSPALSESVRQEICEVAADIARSCAYRGAGTVEFVYGGGEFYFLEMNTRLQVEHAVTEMITGLDLVAEQLHVAAGRPLSLRQCDVRRSGHAVEARIYAEDPDRDFAPTTGPVLVLRPPAGGARFDGGVLEGGAVTSAFDPMIGKLIARGVDRTEALARAEQALSAFVLLGVPTNIEFLRRLLTDPDVVAGAIHTGLIGERQALYRPEPPSPEILDALIAAVALSSTDLMRTVDATPRLHAVLGAWRN
jgi:acetyl/propionyl-CoA carboxylase alpha subunit